MCFLFVQSGIVTKLDFKLFKLGFNVLCVHNFLDRADFYLKPMWQYG
jgi:hypothetical protein